MKSHYDVLDGLRGVAALSVFLFHILEFATAGPDQNPLYYSYLAVDFFFVLSGFVLGYAYDSRLSSGADPVDRLCFKAFLSRRLIRLHPLVIAGVVLGLAGFLAGPLVGQKMKMGVDESYELLMLNFALALLALPAPALYHCFNATHSLDAPLWSLTQEYLASFLYGLFGRRLGRIGLAAVWLASAVGLVLVGLHFKHFALGWGWKDAVWVAPVRMLVSFSAGLLIHRLNLRLKVPQSFVVLTVVLLCVFLAPRMQMKTWNGIFDLLCILVIFPLIVMAGVGKKSASGTFARSLNRDSSKMERSATDFNK